MINNLKVLKYKCPFCSNSLESRFSKCFNVYCQGHKFNFGNLVIFRLNSDLGIGRIVKKIDIPASRSLDDEDSYFITKYKVLFENNIIKIIHPLDLIHYVFEVNERIITKKGVGVINSKDFVIKEGSLSYEIIFSNGKLAQIYESEIISKYETPVKRIISKQRIDPPENFLLKYWANLFYSYYTSYQIKCITNSRLSLMPHQINVAHRLSEEYFPRIILADEVGLGKTIEAGIYIKEMMARNLAERILIVVPATLVKQWQFEMQNKFNIEFTIYDGKKIKELKKIGNRTSTELFQNPFYYDNFIICSLQFAKNRKYINFLSQISWDIVVFDEAHHLRRYLINATTGNYRETLNYDLARSISLSTESLLLLSATPLQLNSFELYSLIELIQGEAFDNFSDFEHFRKNLPFINLLVANVNQIDKLNNFEVKNTIKLLKNLKYINTDKNNEGILELLKNDNYRLNLLKKIEEDHTLSKFLIRNRKKNVFSEEFLNKRVVKTIVINPTKQELEIYNEIRLYLAKIYNTATSKENIGIGFIITTLQKLLTSSKYAFLKSLDRRLEQIERLKSISFELNILRDENPECYESELKDQYIDSDFTYNNDNKSVKESEKTSLGLLNQEKIIRQFYDNLKALPYDSKSEKLVELLNKIYSQNSNEKILVFTQFVDTLLYLKDLLNKQKEDYYVETFYGGLNKVEKDEAVERFRESNKFSILLSTEIGGEGRNFQFARVLINYDLPWNPMKLEQRIGRLDRIGQKSKEIYIYNFYMEGTVETDIMFALDKRIHLFEESIGQLEPIIGRIQKDLKNIIFTEEKGKRRKKLNEFNRKLDLEVKRARELEMQLDDLLIDKKSFRIDDLITSWTTCKEVRLSHNELFLLTRYFFNLNHNKFGFVDVLKEEGIKVSEKISFETKITVNDILLKNPRYKFLKEYVGTFDLNLAREREEIDFFALGHPLINEVLDFCTSGDLEGTFTRLNLTKDNLSENLINLLSSKKDLYLFVFNVKFQGYILENQFSAVIVDDKGNEIPDLADIVLDIKRFQDYLVSDTGVPYKAQLNLSFLEQLTQKAKSLVKWKTSQWKKEIKALNAKIFDIETSKKEKIFSYKRRVLSFRQESLRQKLDKKKNQSPTERQLLNIKNIDDRIKKQERLDKIENLKEELQFLKKKILSIDKKLDDLAFEYEDLKKEMEKRNIAKYYTNLSSFAIIHIK